MLKRSLLSERVEAKLAIFLAAALLAMGLALVTKPVVAETVYNDCSGITCTSLTTWWVDYTTYKSYGTSGTDAQFYVIGTETFGYNYAHIGSQGAAIDHQWCYQGDVYACITGVLYVCDTLSYPSGCGSTTNKWYTTTRHQYLRYSWSPLNQYYTSSTGGGRSSSTCWYGSSSCIY